MSQADLEPRAENRDFPLKSHLWLAGGVAAALLLLYFAALKLVLG